MRSFSGLLVTCSLDHILFMNEERADYFNYGPRKTVSSSLHGRIETIRENPSSTEKRGTGMSAL